MAQATELKMAQALTGKPETDNPNLKTLQSMFAGGIKQNQQNAKDVSVRRQSEVECVTDVCRPQKGVLSESSVVLISRSSE